VADSRADASIGSHTLPEQFHQLPQQNSICRDALTGLPVQIADGRGSPLLSPDNVALGGGGACGVSFVICSHNGASRIADTLSHLAALRIEGGLSAEVIVVDNASDDGSAQVALQSWPQNCPIPLRVIEESRLGLSYARARGFDEAIYELITFVDDDNWLSPDWLSTVVEVMSEHPEVGACFSAAQAATEAEPPWWFERFKSLFAIGPGLGDPADLTENPGLLWGAGLTVRKSAWRKINGRGFNFLLSDRQGEALTDGGDTELCCALRLAGWRLRFDPRLKLRHFLPRERVRWDNLRARHRGGGLSSVGLDPYYFVWRRRKGSFGARYMDWARTNWKWQAGAEATRLLTRWLPGLLLWPLRSVEGKESVLGAEYSVARLKKLCQMRGEYDQTVRNIGLQWNGAVSGKRTLSSAAEKHAPVPPIISWTVGGARNLLRSLNFRGNFPDAAQFLDVIENFVTDPYRTPQWFEERYATGPDFWNYTGDPAERARHLLALEILNDLRQGGRFRSVLEIGCAEGLFTAMVAPYCESLLALDFAPAALERARRRCARWPAVQFQQWDLRSDPVPAGFDLILAMDILYCFRRPSALRTAADKIVAAMRPGDYLLAGDTRESELFEKTWWGRRFCRGGKWVVETVRLNPALEVCRQAVNDTHVFGLFRKRQVRGPST
jgi:glycosyltransferase involved in cell wall biosynthesis/SAM-dependent methyltransferase